MWKTSYVVLACLLAGTWPSVAQTASQAPVILNYWTHLNDILSNETFRRNTTSVRPSGRYLPRKVYPFENVQHLRARDLMRAVQEGINAARTASWGKPAEEVQRQIRQNIVTALEYYPLVAQDERELKPLYYAMADVNGEVELRMFLLRSSMPGASRPSLFGLYLREALAHNTGETRKYLKTIVDHVTENPQVQRTAIEAYFYYMELAYTQVLKTDPAVAAFAADRGQAFRPVMLMEAGAPQPSGSVAQLLKDYDAQWFDFALTLSGYAQPGSNRPIEVREASRACLERIYREMPLSNRDVIKELLDRTAPVTPA